MRCTVRKSHAQFADIISSRMLCTILYSHLNKCVIELTRLTQWQPNCACRQMVLENLLHWFIIVAPGHTAPGVESLCASRTSRIWLPCAHLAGAGGHPIGLPP